MFFRHKNAAFRSVVRRQTDIVGLIAWMLITTGCEQHREDHRYGGSTMGTEYRITANCPMDSSALVADELRTINGEMSTYQENSEISEFNRMSVGKWISVSPDLISVAMAALELSRVSAGAFDVTVGPLVNLWGFGPTLERFSPPDSAAIQEAVAQVGFAHLLARYDPPGLFKSQQIYVDLSAIAKGHGVDRLSAVLNSARCTDFLIDIGGEVRAQGLNPEGERWRIGVEVPDPNRVGAIQRVLSLNNEAVATSGDYRIFFESRGQRYSHTIDPRTGYPVTHELAAVTVIHPSAMWADGYATAFNVLGPVPGLKLATDLELAALFIVHTENGFEERYTPAMRKRLTIAE